MSDVTITSDTVTLNNENILDNHPIKMMSSKIISICKIYNTAIITLNLPTTEVFNFNAGQYIDIILGGKTRSYSIANSPHNSGVIELHVKYREHGLFSQLVKNELQIGSIVHFRGPFGKFQLQNTTKPIIFVCTGTGFAPIKAIIDEMVHNNNSRKVYLYWGNINIEDFYLRELVTKLTYSIHLQSIFCLSSNNSEGYFTGSVTDAITQDFKTLANYEVYACGNQNMITDIFNLTTKKLGLNSNNFFSDSFIPAEKQ